jgi:hypothetical protein
MFNTIVGAGAALRYGFGSDQKIRLLADPAPQHWLELNRGFSGHETYYRKITKYWVEM